MPTKTPTANPTSVTPTSTPTATPTKTPTKNPTANPTTSDDVTGVSFSLVVGDGTSLDGVDAAFCKIFQTNDPSFVCDCLTIFTKSISGSECGTDGTCSMLAADISTMPPLCGPLEDVEDTLTDAMNKKQIPSGKLLVNDMKFCEYGDQGWVAQDVECEEEPAAVVVAEADNTMYLLLLLLLVPLIAVIIFLLMKKKKEEPTKGKYHKGDDGSRSDVVEIEAVSTGGRAAWGVDGGKVQPEGEDVLMSVEDAEEEDDDTDAPVKKKKQTFMPTDDIESDEA